MQDILSYAESMMPQQDTLQRHFFESCISSHSSSIGEVQLYGSKPD